MQHGPIGFEVLVTQIYLVRVTWVLAKEKPVLHAGIDVVLRGEGTRGRPDSRPRLRLERASIDSTSRKNRLSPVP